MCFFMFLPVLRFSCCVFLRVVVVALREACVNSGANGEQMRKVVAERKSPISA